MAAAWQLNTWHHVRSAAHASHHDTDSASRNAALCTLITAPMHGGRCATEVFQLAGSGTQRFNTAQDPEPVNCPPHTMCGRQTSCTAQIYYYYYYYYYYYISTNVSSCTAQSVGRDSSVGIATRYGMDDAKESNPGGGRDFPTGPMAHPASSTTGNGSRSWG